ncbi:Imm32 family immunity protein [Pseudomarimonas arenosa]|uniref:Imm32 family immunity protein n=1 Tax=Pseudomarimonas arenosa TaxID=2774145 RepID=UPI003CCD000D
MRVFGYPITTAPAEEISPEGLAEITLCASPEELREMSLFLSACAEEMEIMGPSYGHVHLSDRHKRFEDSPHFVVVRD